MVWLSTPAREILDRLPRTSPWIFPSRKTGRSINPSTLTKIWHRIRAEAQLHDVRLHDLRHSYASVAVLQGENILAIGRLLGHNNSETTLKYIHLADDKVFKAAEAVGTILGRSRA